MRMWNINPKLMCRQHLLGEHNELHMIVGCMKHDKKLDGYIKNNLIDIHKIYSRHEQLANEMIMRGYKHNSQLNEKEIDSLIRKYLDNNYNGKIESFVNYINSFNDLKKRCKECRNNMKQWRF
jgi:hypothetical protein